MNALVVDTDVASIVFKRHTLSEAYLDVIGGKQLALSFMTVAELHLWALRGGWGDQKRSMLANFLNRFSVCFCDEELCAIWAEVRQSGFRQGQPIDSADAWIAATALYLGLPLVTHNQKHFRKIQGLQVLSCG